MTTPRTFTLVLPPRALARLTSHIANMEAEDKKPVRQRDSRVYATGYAIVETYGLLLRVSDPSDPAQVVAAVLAVTVPDAAFVSV
jgi:hypothetical protein